MFFEPESRRLKNTFAEHIVYGWEEAPTQVSFPTSQDDFANSDFENESPFGDSEDFPW
jgi:hypothetical protein